MLAEGNKGSGMGLGRPEGRLPLTSRAVSEDEAPTPVHVHVCVPIDVCANVSLQGADLLPSTLPFSALYSVKSCGFPFISGCASLCFQRPTRSTFTSQDCIWALWSSLEGWVGAGL